MNIAIIADDMTGASDTGVQFAKQGYAVSVALDAGTLGSSASPAEVRVFDSDSRALAPKEAYTKVYALAKRIRDQGYDCVYKKFDSTLRGNIGAELDAVYDAFRPDFIIVAPAFPKAGRVIRDGILTVDGTPVHETELSRDLLVPIPDSFVPGWLRHQTFRSVAHVPISHLRTAAAGETFRLDHYARQNVSYLVFDAETDEDLERIADTVRRSPYRVVWAGSAGLAPFIPGISVNRPPGDPPGMRAIPNGPVLLVVGSINRNSRRQLGVVLEKMNAVSVSLNASKVLRDDVGRDEEIGRVISEFHKRRTGSETTFVLYTSGEESDVAQTLAEGLALELDRYAINRMVSKTLGEIGAAIASKYGIRKMIAAGGDTARQLSLQCGAGTFELWSEIEPGVPLGKLEGENGPLMITKAGGFGAEQVLLRSVQLLTKE